MPRMTTVEIGDMVEVGGDWRGYKGKPMRGIVCADDRAWYVIRDHYEINNCIVSKNDIIRVIKKHAYKPNAIADMHFHFAFGIGKQMSKPKQRNPPIHKVPLKMNVRAKVK